MFDYLLNLGAALFVAYIFYLNPHLITSLPADVIEMVSDISSEIASFGR